MVSAVSRALLAIVDVAAYVDVRVSHEDVDVIIEGVLNA